MQIVDFIVANGAWSWVVAGLVLLGLELVVPGGVLVWLGGAALITGVASLVLPIYWPLQFVIFGVLALVAIWVWLRVRGAGIASDRPYLNARADRFIGREIVLTEPISGGAGRVSLDDTVWRIEGPDLAAGARIRIVGASAAVLKVEAA
jgi:membrane protein implicated in regulation of membrane protease activity